MSTWRWLMPILLQLHMCTSVYSSGHTDLIYISEFASQSSQHLSFYSWYGNVRLFRFQVPEDTILLRWLLQASRGRGAECHDTEITVHFRHGAPPVINPLGSEFSKNTTFRPPYSISLHLTSNLHNNTFVNVTNPAAGEWFIAAHLPQADQKIGIKGFSSMCAYIFQPDMFLLRVMNAAILEPNTTMRLSITSPIKPMHLKIFIPEYTLQLKISILNCATNSFGFVCPLRLTLGSVTMPLSNQKKMVCADRTECSVKLDFPPWETWVPFTLESIGDRNLTISLETSASFTECKPAMVRHSTLFTFFQQLNVSMNMTSALGIPQSSPNGPANNSIALAARIWDMDNASLLLPSSSFCMRNLPVIREDLDVVSIRFRTVSGPFVSIPAEFPVVIQLNLDSGMDNGGMLTVSLQLNKTTLPSADAIVIGCLSASSPVMRLNISDNCTTAFFQGYPFKLNTSFTESIHGLPFPETGIWYLTIQVFCPKNRSTCRKVKTKVMVSAALDPCADDCGPYGECRLLRRHGYLYAACTCKAGWSGWSCTDATNAISFLRQVFATLLLTLSNLMFLPAIFLAISRYFFVEASVYTFTMFFSTFYHACDQPGTAVMCIMDYDTLQYCDFLGSVVSIWVTLLCMSRVKHIFKYMLFILGTLLIAMSMQLDRRGIWNLMGPCLFAINFLIVAWVYRGVKRRHCYPPDWKRWVFFLLPGVLLALIAVSVYAFLETTMNYFYTHSLWHVMVSGSVAFLLPPREKHKKPWAWSWQADCRYGICQDEREELYVVT
ncbi:post-GPI attachment to proteins factor 6 isoform X1 [Pleurodeles waltl]|uniref:post-GPI attachment to proteins factor 6 isoform X1 n=1 Tax=Pleurodeles waltl TaxID=8319 RepID=UPI0037099A20